MTEAPEQQATNYAHILTDLHQQCREVSAMRAELLGIRDDLLNPIYGQLSELRAALDELLPAARRAAAMLDTPVTSFLAARQEARANGGDQRAGTRTGRGRRARPARRQLPDA